MEKLPDIVLSWEKLPDNRDFGRVLYKKEFVIMTYFDEIRELTKLIPISIVDFSKPRDRTSPPTQASSNFITNKEQRKLHTK